MKKCRAGALLHQRGGHRDRGLSCLQEPGNTGAAEVQSTQLPGSSPSTRAALEKLNKTTVEIPAQALGEIA